MSEGAAHLDAGQCIERVHCPPSAPTLIAVEHPCFVVNPAKAMQMLGGTEALAQASCGSAGTLHCHLRQEDPLSHPLYGELVTGSTLVLKVTRAADRAEGAAGSSATVVGVAQQSYRFRGLTDFQFTSSGELLDALRAPQPLTAAPPDAIASVMDAHALRIPPVTFCNEDTPYAFLPLRPGAARRGHVATRDPAADGPEAWPAAAPRRRRSSGKSQPMHFGTGVDFATAEVPAAPSSAVARTIEQTDPLYVAMRERFAQRPIWSRQALRSALRADLVVSQERLRFRLPQLAYYFTNGPWRLCWVAYGYDPRHLPDSRLYQVLDLRLPAELDALVPKKCEKVLIGAPRRLRAGALSEGGKPPMPEAATQPVPDDRQLPKQRVAYLQLCDLKGEAVRHLVRLPPPRALCDRPHRANARLVHVPHHQTCHPVEDINVAARCV